MGLWEQIVNGKVKKCIHAELSFSTTVDKLFVQIAKDFINGKIIFSKDNLSFEKNDNSYFCRKTPYIGITENGSYIYQETDVSGGYTFQFIINQKSSSGQFISSLGRSFDTDKIYLIIDLKFS